MKPGRLAPCVRIAIIWLGAAFAPSGCGRPTSTGDARFPPLPPGCPVQLFHGKISGIAYNDVGRVDAICSNRISEAACLDELRNQSCKLGGDLVYDVPDDPERPSPDQIRFTGRVAHTHASKSSAKSPSP